MGEVLVAVVVLQAETAWEAQEVAVRRTMLQDLRHQ